MNTEGNKTLAELQSELDVIKDNFENGINSADLYKLQIKIEVAFQATNVEPVPYNVVTNDQAEMLINNAMATDGVGGAAWILRSISSTSNTQEYYGFDRENNELRELNDKEYSAVIDGLQTILNR